MAPPPRWCFVPCTRPRWALFSEALRLNMRLIAGKVMMDRHVPDYLCETAGESYEQTRALIRRWHQRGRLGYAITPRFAPTSTPGCWRRCSACGPSFDTAADASQ